MEDRQCTYGLRELKSDQCGIETQLTDEERQRFGRSNRTNVGLKQRGQCRWGVCSAGLKSDQCGIETIAQKDEGRMRREAQIGPMWD